MTSKQNRHQRQKSDPYRKSGLEAKAPRDTNWPFILTIALIVCIGLGLWGYLKWAGNNLTAKVAKQENSTLDPPNQLLPASDNKQPTWDRACEDSTCGWVTDVDQVQEWNKIDDAASDGWDTEVFTNAAMRQFEKLKHVLTDHSSFEDDAVSFIVDKEAAVQNLVPKNLETTFHDSAISVQRAKTSTEPRDDGNAELRTGSGGLAQSLRELIAPFNDGPSTRIKIKIFRVEKQADSIKTLQTVEIFGPTGAGVKEINSIWVAHWTADNQNPIIKDIRVSEYESADCAGKKMFAECTESVLGQSPGFQKQLLHGYNHWLDRSQFQRFFDLLGTPGVAVGDVNADGLEDLYVCQEGGLPNLLFLQKPDGSLEDFSHQSQADWIQQSRTALLIDLNNDGFEDLAVGVDGGVVLAQGDGSGRFTKRAVLDSSDDVLALAAADYDLDGRLDLFVGAYYPNEYGGEAEEESVSTPGFVYYDAKTGAPNSLFHNDIDGEHWNFSDVTESSDLNEDNNRYTLAASWEDFDNDGDQDLFVANDYGPKNLYRNDLNADGSRTFVDIAQSANAEDFASGMSVAWGDYNRDGWMDVYVSNMFSYAGNRIMYQNQFKPEVDDEIKQTFQRFARGNTLLKNLGTSDSTTDLKFEDRSIEAAVNRGRWAWGSAFVDINNDGWEDLVVANGYITTENSGDL